jgi:asparagine synthase (glutamine-hydrolysing)
MSYRYIALLAHKGAERDTDSLDREAKLREMGLRSIPVSSAIKLFVSRETPALEVPGGGVLIGHVFRRDGVLVADGTELPSFRDPAQARKYLIDSCWGAYLLIQPMADRARDFTILRDPSGAFPCIYCVEPTFGFITSDIALPTSINLYRKRINWDHIAYGLMYPYVKTGRTGLTGVNELLPGCALHTLGPKTTTSLEWSPWTFVTTGKRYRDSCEAAADVRSAVAMVVRAWANLDEIILLELSGGIDSSIVGVCLKHTRARVVCVSVVTPTPGADERRYARLVAEKLGVELNADTLRFEDALFNFEPPSHPPMPRIGSLQYALDQVIGAAGERLGATSYFSGSGGDTVFCYLNNAAPAADAFRECGFAPGMSAIRNLAELHNCTLWKAGRLTLRKLLRAPKAPYKADYSMLAQPAKSDVGADHPWFVAPKNALPGDRERISDLAGNQVFIDNMPRGSKWWARTPLLSQPVMEAYLAVPSWMWISGGRNRAIARDAFADLLPRDVLSRRSKGTFMSYLGAVYQKNKEQMRDFLLTGHLQAHGLLDADAVRSRIENPLPPRDESFTRIFELCMAENWVRHQV